MANELVIRVTVTYLPYNPLPCGERASLPAVGRGEGDQGKWKN